jgi:hypothetical protein
MKQGGAQKRGGREVHCHVLLHASVSNRNGVYRTRTQCFFSRRTKEGEVREYPTTMDRRREESGDRRVECSTWVWIRAAQFKIYCADAGSRRFLYMRLLSDFERFPALHLTLANTPLHLKQLRDVVQTRPQKKR